MFSHLVITRMASKITRPKLISSGACFCNFSRQPRLMSSCMSLSSMNIEYKAVIRAQTKLGQPKISPQKPLNIVTLKSQPIKLRMDMTINIDIISMPMKKEIALSLFWPYQKIINISRTIIQLKISVGLWADSRIIRNKAAITAKISRRCQMRLIAFLLIFFGF